jgi:excisionase family DNA binding protein
MKSRQFEKSEDGVAPSMEPLAVDVEEGARLCGLSRTMMYALIKAKRIDHLKFGHRTLLRMTDLRALISGKR